MKLLIVEDDVTLGKILAEIFEGEPGVDKVFRALTLEGTLELVMNGRVDAVLSDGWFYWRNLLEPAWRILYQAARAKGIPFTLLTGDFREADYARELNVPVIERPFHLDNLVAQVMGRSEVRIDRSR